MRATIERLRMEREATLAEFEALTHPPPPAPPRENAEPLGATVPALVTTAIPGPTIEVDSLPALAADDAAPSAVPSPAEESGGGREEPSDVLEAAQRPGLTTGDQAGSGTTSDDGDGAPEESVLFGVATVASEAPVPEVPGQEVPAPEVTASEAAAPQVTATEPEAPTVPGIPDDEGAGSPAVQRPGAPRLVRAALVLAMAGAAAYWVWLRPVPTPPSSSVDPGAIARAPDVESRTAPSSTSSAPAPADASGSSATTTAPSAASATTSVGTRMPTQAPGAVGDAAAPSTAGQASRLRVELDASRNVWMRLLVDGETVSNRIVKEGEHLSLDAERLVEVRIGDAGAVRLTVNGEARGLLGRPGQVLTQRITR